MPIKTAAKDVRADPVQAEIRAWDSITDSSLLKDGMLDEFACCPGHKSSYPLHYFPFRICEAHMAYEAIQGNTESAFSVDGMLTGHSTIPAGLQVLARLNHNRSAYEPGWQVILQRCKEMFRKHFRAEVQDI